MWKKGCIVAVLAVLVVVIGGVTALYFLYQGMYNPYHKGKRVYAWADQAMKAPDPWARQEAVQALSEAFKDMTLGPRVHLTMHFCGRETLPKELVPFLIETLHIEQLPSGSYPSMALSRVEDNAAVPALVDVILHDDDSHARDGAISAICQMYSQARVALPALQDATGDRNEEVQRRAREAIGKIEQVLDDMQRLERHLATSRK
jgi:hypothetical protein